MEKYISGIYETILVIPQEAHVTPEMESFFDRIIRSPQEYNIPGYIAQQLDKLDAYKYVNSDYILYSDSDCIYSGHFEPSMLFHDGLPILNMTPYTELGTTVPWQRVVEQALGFVPVYEFMRCFPIIHRTETVAALANDYPGLKEHGRYIYDRAFSEFNFIGAYAYRNRHPYHFTEECRSLPCRQFWSWSGLLPEEKAEIESILRITTPT